MVKIWYLSFLNELWGGILQLGNLLSQLVNARTCVTVNLHRNLY